MRGGGFFSSFFSLSFTCFSADDDTLMHHTDQSLTRNLTPIQLILLRPEKTRHTKETREEERRTTRDPHEPPPLP